MPEKKYQHSGQPTKCNHGIIDKLTSCILSGMTIERACEYVNIDTKTYYNWLNAGRNSTEDSIFREFFHSIIGIEAKCIERHLKKIDKSPEWKSSAWLLERRFRKEYGKKESLELSGPDGNPIEVQKKVAEYDELPEEALLEIEAIMRKHSKKDTEENPDE
ncbi:MAG: hypothetical protein DRH26_01315 [Deltaproteobacteria bacterium]|nr:MAG: hypothetical protein DRH26_01315 [Deltaproteobacteria bacterium]